MQYNFCAITTLSLSRSLSCSAFMVLILLCSSPSPSCSLPPFNSTINACSYYSSANWPRRAMDLSCSSWQQVLPASCLYNCLTDSSGPRVSNVSAGMRTDHSKNILWVQRWRRMGLSCFSPREQALPARCMYNCRSESAETRVFVMSCLYTNRLKKSMLWLRQQKGMNVCWFSRQTALPARYLHNCLSDRAGPRVFVVSDLHTDYLENMSWVRRLSSVLYKKDVLIVAGDVAEMYKNFVNTMSELRDRFQVVFFVPGNHDLWCRREGENYLDSLEKLDMLLDACRELGVSTRPRTIDGVGIIPLFSWYHKSFDKEKDVTGVRIPSLEMACKDFHACKWPEELSNNDASLSQYFDLLNEKNLNAMEQIRKKSNQIITFSHFVPRQELCPEKRMLFYPNLPKIIGSDPLEVRIRSIHGQKGNTSACHVFGHTHFCWDAVLDGIRYVQAPLAYPRERKRRMNGGEDWLPFCVYDCGLTEQLSPSFWSDYYTKNKREPENTELAPWVARFYRS
ncbi:Metallo-dependent phosphatases protein [Dioscorea alata]|uniref:Metallo-dependent phosphatases protein n=1 Tax=Dioscorea alata TaxID=55571 RepID=A0ACB7UR17_DIOAL|nr:Metallo-dependent phosphatases protein [Dioscorea alata]